LDHLSGGVGPPSLCGTVIIKIDREREKIMQVRMRSKREAGGWVMDVIGTELAANRLKHEQGIQGDLRFAHTVTLLPPLPLLKKLIHEVHTKKEGNRIIPILVFQ